jgi:hypothetical protein
LKQSGKSNLKLKVHTPDCDIIQPDNPEIANNIEDEIPPKRAI